MNGCFAVVRSAEQYAWKGREMDTHAANENFTPEQMYPQVTQGTPIYGAEGDKVGVVGEELGRHNYLMAQKGWIFPKDLYIPLSAIRSAGPNGVHLNLTKDELQNDRYQQPPAETAAATGIGARERMQPAGPGREVRIPVTEEELVAGRERVREGDVHVHEGVVEKPETITAPVTHEEVVVEREPVEGRTAADVGPDAFKERDIDIPVYGEKLVPEKRAEVVEDVLLRKQPVTEQEQVSGTVRKDVVNVEGNPEDLVRREGQAGMGRRSAKDRFYNPDGAPRATPPEENPRTNP